MHTVVYIIFFGHFTCKLDSDCFQSLRLARCSTRFTICNIIHPAISLYMSLIFNASFILRICKINLNCFQSLRFAGRSAHFAIVLGSLPSVSLYMSAVSNLFCNIRSVCITRSISSFSYKNNFNSFQSLRKSCCSGFFTILSPVKPSISLCMNTIVNIIFFCNLTSQVDLNCFQSLRFAGCSAHLSVSNRILPSIALNMSRILDTAAVFCIKQLNLNSFQSLGFAGCSTHFTVFFPLFFPSVALNMGHIPYSGFSDCHFTSCFLSANGSFDRCST